MLSAALKNELLRHFPDELYISGHVISVSKHSVPAHLGIMHVLSTKPARPSRSWLCKAFPHLPLLLEANGIKHFLTVVGWREAFSHSVPSTRMSPLSCPPHLSKPLEILSGFQMLQFSPSFQLGVVFLF